MFVNDPTKVIMHSDMAEDDATEHRIARRVTTEWEVDWVRRHYAEDIAKEAAAKEEYSAALARFKRAAGNYTSAMSSVNNRLEEAIESAIALPGFQRDGVTPTDEPLTFAQLILEYKARAETKTKIDAASQLASATDW